MNKRTYIFLICSLAFIGVGYIPNFEPKRTTLEDMKNVGMEGNASSQSFQASALPSPYPFGIKTVVIDAGHGGKDPGCLGITSSKEKDIALAIALKLGKYIQEKTPDVKVIYTRTTDVFIDLDERAAIANRNDANLFICIHCNTACSISKQTKKKVCNEEVFGTETYVMGPHKTNANLNVAMRENASINLEKNKEKRYEGFENTEAGYILITMQQNAFRKQSTAFAEKVQKHVKEKAGRHDKSVQEAGFLVLWRTKMPSVLIETEFLSNTESEKFMVSEKGQDEMARAIFSAFREYKDEVEGRYVKYDDEVEKKDPAPIKKDTTRPKEIKEKQEVKEQKPKADSTPKIKEPVIENETKAETAPKDSGIVKNEMMPPIKEKTEKKDTVSAPSGPGQIIYKVQFMSSGQRVPLLSDKFKGLKDVGEYEDNGSFKYTAGEFKTMDEAMKYWKEMRTKGHPDCFVVKFRDGKRMKN